MRSPGRRTSHFLLRSASFYPWSLRAASMPNASERVLILGLDSVPPELLFDRFRPMMPNLQKLLQRCKWGTLRACDPPITVPSWAVMFTGMDPGTLGIYGFRHRRPRTYWDTYSPSP